MQQFDVLGMSCAACSARVEKAVNSVDGVNTCVVNLLTNSMTVEGVADNQAIIEAVTKAGYKASVKGQKMDKTSKNATSKSPITQLILSAAILLILMYFAMGHSMLNLPYPTFFIDYPAINGLIQLFLALTVLIINNRFFINGFKAVLNLAPNMDTLVALGSSAAFIYSAATIFVMQFHIQNGDISAAHKMLHNLYFEASAMILVIVRLGKLLEERSKRKTTSAIDSLIKMSPKTATVIIDGVETKIDASNVKIGDVFVVRPGENIPLDAIILEGKTAIDESALTGESLPVDKFEGDKVFAATMNQFGFIKCKATSVVEDTSFAKIIKLVSDAAASKAPIGRIADKIAGIFTPVVLSIAIITFIVWQILDAEFSFSLARAISVLVISCPCALGLATPVAIMVGSGVGAKNGILYKNAAILEKAAKAKIIAFDKTGTVTLGKPKVTDIYPIGVTENELLSIAGGLEAKSEHPLSRAIMEKLTSENITPYEVTNFSASVNGGISATFKNSKILGGNHRFISKHINISEDASNKAKSFANQGKTPMYFAMDTNIIGIIAVADTIKKDTATAVSQLKNLGLKCVMLTGDNSATAKAIANEAGIETVYSELMPEDKNNIINELKTDGTVIMVGDGINDAPALTTADIGVSMSAATDIAIEASDIVLISDKMTNLPAAIRLSRKTLHTIYGNLFWAFLYNALCIPFAAGAFVTVLNGFTINPMLASAAMSLSSICVVSNAIRLNFVKIFDKKEKKKMQKTLTIEGMMCPHCENRVKTLLEALSGVTEANVSHKTNTAIITFTEDISNDMLINLITDAGYKVTNIE